LISLQGCLGAGTLKKENTSSFFYQSNSALDPPLDLGDPHCCIDGDFEEIHVKTNQGEHGELDSRGKTRTSEKRHYIFITNVV